MGFLNFFGQTLSKFEKEGEIKFLSDFGRVETDGCVHWDGFR